MKKKFKTLNNLPNSKWWASTIAGVATLAVAAGAVFGLEMEVANVEQALFGLATFIVIVMQIAGYLKRPGEGDGIKEDK